METVLTPASSDLAVPAATPAKTTADVTLSVDEMMCGICVRSIEQTLMRQPGVAAARANLSARRVSVTYDPAAADMQDLVTSLKGAGFTAAELLDDASARQRAAQSELIPRVGVAGFAAANIMLLSVSVWSGHGGDMDSSIQTLFHWLSALIALPAVAYSGLPFFRSAANALRGRRLNMDVPISLGILLATAMSLFQTMRGTEQVYFDAAVTLVFFLLVGRMLDDQMRQRTRSAAENLLSLKALTATVIDADGTTRQMPGRALQPGMRILVAAGERISGDGVIVSGSSEVDESLITGETVPRSVWVGDRVHAGTINGGGPLQIETTATEENTLLSEIARMIIAGEQSRSRYVRLADRAARIYAPAVHILGLTTFIAWMIYGAGWEQSLTYAIAVLIITCPCALALAVPAVQVAATSRLFANGVIVKSADGLERLAEVDTIILDKTGTLTLGWLRLVDDAAVSDTVLAQAAAIAVSSRHPYAQALVSAARARGLAIPARENVTEIAGSGLVAMTPEGEERLGSAKFIGAPETAQSEASLWYARPGEPALSFRFEDQLRSDAASTVHTLQELKYAVELLSGDRAEAVNDAARAAGISTWRGAARPEEKLARLEALKAAGYKTLMVGDGLNDAPALAAGHASISPSTAADISQTAADAVFQGNRLDPVIETLLVARASLRMSLQNFAIAIAYNVAFVPLAMLGYVTPLVAALAMSTSSILVTANAIRLRSMKLRTTP